MSALLLWGLLAAGALPAAQPTPVNRCVVCHTAAARPSSRVHLAEWSKSAHAAGGVTCDRCHGGDPAASTMAEAHRGVMASRYAASRVYRKNLPSTCGECHPAELDAFRKSAHSELLSFGVRLGPVCSDCHGATATALPDPAALERRCARCHTTGSAGGDRPRRAGQALRDLTYLRGVLQRTARQIEREPDLARYERLQREQREARVRVLATVESFHLFNEREMGERLVRARVAVEALLEQFEGPPTPPEPASARRHQPADSGTLLIRSVFGPDVFAAYCASCHDRDGTGRGGAGPPPDLTTIARRSGGQFPRERVTALLAPRAAAGAHDSDGMPIWGSLFEALDPREHWTAIRIQNLVDYLASIQR